MSEKQREAFEEWAKSQYLNVFWSHNIEEYTYTTTQSSWIAWQAAIASVVVELPELYVDGVDAAEFFDDVKLALDEAGVKYK